MSNSWQRQQERDAKEIDNVLDRMRRRRDRHLLPMGKPRRVKGPAAPRALATREQSAFFDRHIETITAAEHVNPATGEVSSVQLTCRVVTLVDVLQNEGAISMPLHQAAERYREIAAKAAGGSQGIGSYGEYQQSSPASQRCLTNDQQMKAAQEFKAASFAAFGVPTIDGGMALDEQLIQIILPAIFSSKKGITKAAIGAPRTNYAGHGQKQAIGQALVIEVLHRLSLHFGYTQR